MAESGGPEQRIREAVESGTAVDLRSGDAAADDPALGGEWGEERTVPAALLRELLLGAGGGALRLAGARITGRLDLADTTVARGLHLEGCHFEQPLLLRGAVMRSTGLVRCRLPGLDGWLLRVDGNLFFEDSVIDGRLTLTRAHITGELRLSGVRLTAPELSEGPAEHGAWALWAGGLVMEGGCFARKGFVSRGGLRLVGAQFNGGLFVERARIENPGGDALTGDDLSASTLVLDGLTADGALRLPGATVRSRLSLDAAVLGGAPVALEANRLRAGELRLTVAQPPAGTVDLQEAQVGVVEDNGHTWPADSRLDGFVYTSLHLPPGGVEPVARRIAWLEALPGYAPQPYEQLAAWYRKIGHDDDARRVLLAKQRRRRRTLSPLGRVWGRLLDVTVGYGYRPWQAAVWLAVLVAAGATVFAHGQPTQTQPGQGAPFNPVVYTLDLLIPIGGFGQRTAWYWSDYHQWVGYGLVGAGWLLTTAALAGVTRALNRA
ncbi:oxidoreductase [Kitasatospora sp. NPDC090091]|uniref:oxidoreductase n=1 Tax=Kitasatospora sp. NPDC090091 TaxID=3364081 RepID=UPI00382B40C1